MKTDNQAHDENNWRIRRKTDQDWGSYVARCCCSLTFARIIDRSNMASSSTERLSFGVLAIVLFAGGRTDCCTVTVGLTPCPPSRLLSTCFSLFRLSTLNASAALVHTGLHCLKLTKPLLVDLVCAAKMLVCLLGIIYFLGTSSLRP